MISYNVGELKRLIKESANEWNPKMGPEVTSTNAKNNNASYKDAKKRAQDYDGGLKDAKKGKLNPKVDDNRTTLDYNPTIEPDDAYKKRVQAQAKGYNSTLEEKSDTERVGEFDNDGKIFKQFKDHNEEINDNRSEKAHSGLVSKNTKETDLETNRLYENRGCKTKRLTFKNTRFLNEAMMLSKIPESYKVDKQIIHMKDGHDNEYIVECSLSEKTGNIETNIVGFRNKTVMNEQMSRMMQLMNYGNTIQNNTKQSYSQRLDENTHFQELMDIARGKNNNTEK